MWRPKRDRFNAEAPPVRARANPRRSRTLHQASSSSISFLNDLASSTAVLKATEPASRPRDSPWSVTGRGRRKDESLERPCRGRECAKSPDADQHPGHSQPSTPPPEHLLTKQVEDRCV